MYSGSCWKRRAVKFWVVIIQFEVHLSYGILCRSYTDVCKKHALICARIYAQLAGSCCDHPNPPPPLLITPISLSPSLPLKFECIATRPGLLTCGLMCGLFPARAWLTLAASLLALPGYAAHSMIEAIIGMIIAHGGDSCVIWDHQPVDTFPHTEGVSAIAVSWAAPPVLSGVVATGGVLYAVRAFVVRSAHAFGRTFWVPPILTMLTVGINGECFAAAAAAAAEGRSWGRIVLDRANLTPPPRICSHTPTSLPART